MLSGLRQELVACTQPLSPCLWSLLPFILPLSYFILYQLPPTVTLLISSEQSVRFRFVLSLLFPDAPHLGTLSNHKCEQAIASLLIVLRVANRRALTSKSITPGNIGSIHFRSGGVSTGGETLPDGHPVSRVETNGEVSGEFGGGIETVPRNLTPR